MSEIRPLVRWDGAHVVLELAMVERHVRRLVEDGRRVEELALAGAGDRLRVTARVRWRGLVSRVAVEFGELRLRQRRLGMRLRRVRVLGGVAVPRGAVLRIIESAAGDLVTVFADAGIVIVDLRRWLPDEMEITVLTVQATERTLDLWLGPGALRDIPRREPARLPAHTASEPVVTHTAEGIAPP